MTILLATPYCARWILNKFKGCLDQGLFPFCLYGGGLVTLLLELSSEKTRRFFCFPLLTLSPAIELPNHLYEEYIRGKVIQPFAFLWVGLGSITTLECRKDTRSSFMI